MLSPTSFSMYWLDQPEPATLTQQHQPFHIVPTPAVLAKVSHHDSRHSHCSWRAPQGLQGEYCNHAGSTFTLNTITGLPAWLPQFVPIGML